MVVAIGTTTGHITNYVCITLAALLLCLRLACHRFQPKIFDAAFFITVFSIFVLFGRLACVYFTLKDETGNDAAAAIRAGHPFSQEKLSHIETGTLFSLAKRFLETTFWWSQGVVLLLFYRRLVHHVRWTKSAIIGIWAFMAASYLASVLSIFLECQPFRRYWQATPDPGSCVRAYIHTTIQCVTNIIIDVALMAIAVPILQIQGRQTSQRVRIGVLIALGIFCVIITAIRLAYIYLDGSLQPTRSFWASLQILVTAFVANAPIIYGSLKLWRDKKSVTSSRGYGTRSERNTTLITKNDKSGQWTKDLKEDQRGITRTIIVQTHEEDQETTTRGREHSPV